MVSDIMQHTASLFVGTEASAILARLRAFLLPRQIDCFLVGGYVRDAWLGRPSHDVDIVVDGDALTVGKHIADFFGASFVPLDEEHQIVRIVLLQDGQVWHLDLASMRGGSVESDLDKRDFTINAMAVDLSQIRSGWTQTPVIDPRGGMIDLGKGVVRAVSQDVFVDDPARLLRALRFCAELGFCLDDQTENLIRRDRGLLSDVSSERVRDELCRILETDRASVTLNRLDQLDLLDLIFPEMSALRGVDQPKEHFWNVFDHSLQTVVAVERLLEDLHRDGRLLEGFSFSADLAAHFSQEMVQGRTRKGLIKLTALLHDIAKPQTKRFDENGRMRFLGHDKQGAALVEPIMERLRFSSRETKMVSTIVGHHLRPGHLSNAPQWPTRRAIYRYFRDTSNAAIDILFLSLADHLATRGPTLEMEGWHHHVEVTQFMLAKWFKEQDAVLPPRIVTGHDLMEHFGLEPGPRIGELLETVREALACGEIQTRQQAFERVEMDLRRNDANHR